jgi:phenol 2-monooxygenase
LCEFLAASPQSPVRRFTPPGTNIDSVIDVRCVLQDDHLTIGMEAVPAFLLPAKGRLGLQDYEKVFCPDLKSSNDIFDMRGIDRDKGCMVIVRPDQYIAHVLPLEAHGELAAYFERFLRPAG